MGVLLEELDALTCAIYSRPPFPCVDDLRFYMLREKCGNPNDTINPNVNVDLSSLSPCRRSLTQHIRRANYQTAIWKRALLPSPGIPNPFEGHGWHISEGELQPLWTDEEEDLILPDDVI